MNLPLVSEQRLKAFKDKIGFDKGVDDLDPHLGVVADWDGIADLLPSRQAGWELVSDQVAPPHAGVVSRAWTLRKGEGALTLKVGVSSVGPAEARRWLLSDATATMMVEPPYVRGPAGLGQLSIIYPRDPLPVVMWVFHNVYVKLECDEAPLSVEPLARAIQAYMERHVKDRIAAHLPGVGTVRVTPERARVGEEVEVAARPPGGSAVRVRFEAAPADLDSVRQSDTSSVFVPQRPGALPVDVWVLDPKTLLVSRARAVVEAGPARPPASGP